MRKYIYFKKKFKKVLKQTHFLKCFMFAFYLEQTYLFIVLNNWIIKANSCIKTK